MSFTPAVIVVGIKSLIQPDLTVNANIGWAFLYQDITFFLVHIKEGTIFQSLLLLFILLLAGVGQLCGNGVSIIEVSLVVALDKNYGQTFSHLRLLKVSFK